MNLKITAMLFTLGLFASQLHAGPIKQATLPPIEHEQATLTENGNAKVSHGSGEIVLLRAE